MAVTAPKKKVEKNAVQEVVFNASLLLRPIITEKAHAQSERAVYTFLVEPKASKEDIKRAVEGVYSVSVDQVRTTTKKPHSRRFGKTLGTTKQAKKAYVSLVQGQTLDIFGETK